MKSKHNIAITAVPPLASSTTDKGLPLAALLALAMAAFITLLTEIMPAGLLSSIAEGFAVSESLAGQFITAYAIGALLAAIPITALTQGMRRRPLLISAILGFAIVNLITAITGSYTISIIARFFAGVFGGIVWSLLAGYAVRMSPPQLSGRAIAISGAGATIALVLGVPLGSLLGQIIGWQGAFALMSAMAILLILWIIAIVPDFPSQAKAQRQSLFSVFSMHGISAVLFVVFFFVAGHNILYIYIEPFLTLSDLSNNVDIVLLIFGVGSVIGLSFVGTIVDHHLPTLAIGSITLLIFAALLLGFWGNHAWIVYPAVFIWGLAFGGFATITQTALSRFAGDSVDVAQSMYTTGWNTAVAIGGIVGGVLLDYTGVSSFAWVIVAILLISLFATYFAMNNALLKKRQ